MSSRRRIFCDERRTLALGDAHLARCRRGPALLAEPLHRRPHAAGRRGGGTAHETLAPFAHEVVDTDNERVRDRFVATILRVGSEGDRQLPVPEA